LVRIEILHRIIFPNTFPHQIRPEALDLNSPNVFPFPRVALVLGNEGAGMHPSIQQKCDEFVYIPHYGGGTASLNVAVAGSIVFQHFASR
jgi:tRNA G18 (ribose-2'-O)-methylase SpoU